MNFVLKLLNVGNDMNQIFIDSIMKETPPDTTIIGDFKMHFAKFLSAVYDKQHDHRFIDLVLKKNNKKFPALVLSIDANTPLNQACAIQFALFVFMEEWYAHHGFSDVLLEWV